MNESTATRYQRERRRAQALGVAAGLAVSLVLALTGAGSRLAGWAASLTGAPGVLATPAALLVFSAMVAILWEGAALALAAAARGRLDRRSATYDARAGATGMGHVVVTIAMATLAGAAFGGVVLVASWLAPAWWWLIAGVFAGGGLVVALHGGARWLARAAGARPIERPALVEALGALARRVHVPIDSIDQLPASSTLTASALVTGAGQGRRIFIADELMRGWSDDEIAVVVAHELAHHAHRDLWITLAVDVTVLAAAFRAAAGVRDAVGIGVGVPVTMADLPLVALVTGLVWIASAPVRHALSRWQERRADAFALVLTGRPDALQAAVRRLAATHLAEERPSRLTRWLFHRHPSAAERLEAAAAFQRRD